MRLREVTAEANWLHSAGIGPTQVTCPTKEYPSFRCFHFINPVREAQYHRLSGGLSSHTRTHPNAHRKPDDHLTEFMYETAGGPKTYKYGRKINSTRPLGSRTAFLALEYEKGEVQATLSEK